MLERLKIILGITDNSQDAALSQLLLDSQEYIESYLDRNLDLDTYQDFATPNGSNSFALRNYPVTEIAGIENLDGEEVTEFKIIKQSGMVRTKQHLFGDFLIDYTAGYDPLPAWAQKAIIDTAAALYNEIESGGAVSATGAIKSEEIYGVAKISYDTSGSVSSVGGSSANVGSIPGHVVDVLEMHRNRYA